MQQHEARTGDYTGAIIPLHKTGYSIRGMQVQTISPY